MFREAFHHSNSSSVLSLCTDDCDTCEGAIQIVWNAYSPH